MFIKNWTLKKDIVFMATTPDTNPAADLARFVAKKTNHNLFLTGKAGTGKTASLETSWNIPRIRR